MNPPIEENLFTAALERPPSDRALFLDGACREDPTLRHLRDALEKWAFTQDSR